MVHDIQAVGREDYERVLRASARDLTQVQEVLAVYGFGEASHPGISDLDVLVVVADDIPAPSLRAIVEVTRRDHLRRYLFLHPPIVVPEACVPDLRLLHTLYGLRQVAGRALEIPPRPDGIFPDLADYVDFTFALRTALRADPGAGSLRWLLILLKSIAHSLSLAGHVLGQPTVPPFSQRVAEIRQAILADGQRPAPLVQPVLSEGLAALRGTDAAIENFLLETGILHRSRVRECVSYADGRYYLFTTPFHGAGGRQRSLRSVGLGWRLAGVDPSIEDFPGFYLAQFAAYGRSPGLFGEAHRAIFGDRGDMIAHPTYRGLLRRRVLAVERAYRVLRSGGLLPMVPLGLGFRSPERIRPSRRRRWLRGCAMRGVRRA